MDEPRRQSVAVSKENVGSKIGGIEIYTGKRRPDRFETVFMLGPF